MSKEKKAIALRYIPDEDSAPKVLAKGKGYVAERIIKTAEDAKVNVVENKEVAESLFNVEIASEIPSDMFEAVAGILAFVYQLDREFE
ncbi:MAG: EscU/YscU/HrcU family type III secretion system export apparatus switch protein [Tissierellales bacterium]|jgi:flagellar biosynthesis protein|nr:EscU/YscU/HrcU family type III secretion system export apparatus switch protein [Tissierellales bacterium]